MSVAQQILRIENWGLINWGLKWMPPEYNKIIFQSNNRKYFLWARNDYGDFTFPLWSDNGDLHCVPYEFISWTPVWLHQGKVYHILHKNTLCDINGRYKYLKFCEFFRILSPITHLIFYDLNFYVGVNPHPQFSQIFERPP